MKPNPCAVLSALLLAAALGAALGAQDTGRVTELRALGGFRPPPGQQGHGERDSLLPNAYATMPTVAGPLVGLPAETRDEGLQVRELVQRRHQRALGEGRLELGGDGDLLVLRGERDLVAACLRELDALQAAVTRPIEITAMLLPPTTAAPPCVLPPQALAAVLQQRAPSWTAHGRTRSGRELALGSERWIPHVRDIDVEVAQGSAIGDPKVDWAMSGVRVVVAAHPLPASDDLLLLGWFAVGEPVAMREVQTGVEGQPTVDLPECRSAFGTFAARIQNGGAAAITVRAGNSLAPGYTVLVSARCLAPAAPAVAEDLWVLPVSALTATTHMHRVLLGPSVLLPGMDTPRFLEEQPPAADFGQVPAALLVDLLAIDPDQVWLDGGFLLVHAPPPRGNAISGELGRLCDQLLRNAEQHWELRATGAAGNSEPLLALAQPTLLGREAWAFVGRERATVADFAVEISGGSVMANNPVIQVMQSGVWSRGRLRPGPVGLACDGLWSVLAQGPPRERELHGTPPGLLGLVTSDVAAFPWDAPMALDQLHDLGDGPPFLIDGKPVPTRFFVRTLAR